ncbi:MAG: hypothetical protein K2J32_00530 [Ruminococcus sp.]|nr:hypothetical protein [Ruminococcus sp.]
MTESNITEENQHIGYYLIDYENVHQAGLDGIEKLTENDKLVIFYTTNAETLTFSIYEKLVSCKAEIQLYKVQCGGKNALDFQLVTFLGYILGNNPDIDCHIISNDKGYEYVRSFWKEKNVEIKMSSDIAGNVPKLLPVVVAPVQPAPTAKTETDFDKAVKPLNLSKEEKHKVCGIFYSTGNIADTEQRMTKLYKILVKHFDLEFADKYYSALKPLIK